MAQDKAKLMRVAEMGFLPPFSLLLLFPQYFLEHISSHFKSSLDLQVPTQRQMRGGMDIYSKLVGCVS